MVQEVRGASAAPSTVRLGVPCSVQRAGERMSLKMFWSFLGLTSHSMDSEGVGRLAIVLQNPMNRQK